MSRVALIREPRPKLADGIITMIEREPLDVALAAALVARPGAPSRRAEVPSTESGAHVVDLGGGRILMAVDCPKSAEILADLGYEPVTVDISEFEKLEGCEVIRCRPAGLPL